MYIGKVKYGDNTWPVGSTLYGTCDTAANTAAKVVTMPNFDTLLEGVTIHVKFTYSNGAHVGKATLNVNNTGAKTIMRYGTTAAGAGASASWNAGAVVSFTYDGTYWQMNDWLDTDTNTTYTLSTGDSNGQIKVTPSSGSAYNVNVKGLGDRAFDSTAYLPLTGGILSNNSTAPLILNNSNTGISETGIVFRRQNVAKAWVGYADSYGVYLYNSTRQKYLNYKDDGTLLFEGNNVWHAGNDGSGSGLDADTVDGYHASYFVPKKHTTKFYPFINSNSGSSWYKITLPWAGYTSGSYAWMMTTMEIVIGGSYTGGNYGRIYLQYYFLKNTSNVWSANEVRGITIGYRIIENEIIIKYDILNPGIFYIRANNSKYNSISIENVTANDSAISFDFRNITIEGIDQTDVPSSADKTVPLYHTITTQNGYWANLGIQTAASDTTVPSFGAVRMNGVSSAGTNYITGKSGRIYFGGHFYIDSLESYVTYINHYTANNVYLATGGGKVGVGTSSPTEKLSVSGNAAITGNVSSGGDITINSPDWENSYGIHINEGGSSSYGFDIMYGASDKFTISRRNNSTTRTDILEISRTSNNVLFNGNVGIGTNPGYALDVVGVIKASSDIYMGGFLYMPFGGSWLSTIDNDSNGPIFGHALAINSRRVYYTGSPVYICGGKYNKYADGITVTSSNNVGIGTTNPTKKLHVNGDILCGNISGFDTTNSLTFRHLDGQKFSDSDYNLYLQYNQSSYKTFFNGNTYYIQGGQYNGNAASATQLANSRTIWGQSFNGTGNVSGAIFNASCLDFTGVSSSANQGGYIDFHYNGSSTQTSRIIEQTSGNLSLNECLIGSVSDNSYIKLYYPGTGSNVSALRFKGSSYGTANLYVGQYDHDIVLDSRNIYVKCDEVDVMYITKWGNYVGIGTTSPSYKLHVNGACAASSFPNTSDIRLKDVYSDWSPNIEDIAYAPSFLFKWKDGKDKNMHAGTSAQYWQSKAPELVTEAKDDIGTLSIQYDVLGTLSSITLAKEILELKKEIKRLQAQIAEIKQLQK